MKRSCLWSQHKPTLLSCLLSCFLLHFLKPLMFPLFSILSRSHLYFHSSCCSISSLLTSLFYFSLLCFLSPLLSLQFLFSCVLFLSGRFHVSSSFSVVFFFDVPPMMFHSLPDSHHLVYCLLIISPVTSCFSVFPFLSSPVSFPFAS